MGPNFTQGQPRHIAPPTRGQTLSAGQPHRTSSLVEIHGNSAPSTPTSSVYTSVTGASARRHEASGVCVIFQDARYEGLIDECARTVRSIVGRDPGRISMQGCIEIYSNWKHWTCLFPQHGPGRKHGRDMSLLVWQQILASPTQGTC